MREECDRERERGALRPLGMEAFVGSIRNVLGGHRVTVAVDR